VSGINPSTVLLLAGLLVGAYVTWRRRAWGAAAVLALLAILPAITLSQQVVSSLS